MCIEFLCVFLMWFRSWHELELEQNNQALKSFFFILWICKLRTFAPFQLFPFEELEENFHGEKRCSTVLSKCCFSVFPYQLLFIWRYYPIFWSCSQEDLLSPFTEFTECLWNSISKKRSQLIFHSLVIEALIHELSEPAVSVRTLHSQWQTLKSIENGSACVVRYCQGVLDVFLYVVQGYFSFTKITTLKAFIEIKSNIGVKIIGGKTKHKIETLTQK